MQIDYIFWLVGLGFFLPLHLGLPVLYVLVYRAKEQHQAAIKAVLIEGGLSAVVLFGLAAYLSSVNFYLAIGLIVVAMPLPWLRLVLQCKG